MKRELVYVFMVLIELCLLIWGCAKIQKNVKTMKNKYNIELFITRLIKSLAKKFPKVIIKFFKLLLNRINCKIDISFDNIMRFLISFLAIFFILINNNRVTYLKGTIHYLFLIIALSLVYFYFYKIIIYLMIEKNNLASIISTAIIIVCLILYSFFALLAKTVVNNMNFLGLLYCYILNFGVTIYCMYKILKFTDNRKFKSILGMLIIMLLEVSLLMLYGSYNIAHQGNLKMRDVSGVKLLLQLIYYGAYYSFNLVKPDVDSAFYPMIEYLSITFYNIAVFGFSITFFYDVIKQNHKQI